MWVPHADASWRPSSELVTVIGWRVHNESTKYNQKIL